MFYVLVVVCLFSPHVRCPEKASLGQVAIWNLYPPPKIYIKCWNRKKIGTWDTTDIAKRCIEHHPFRHYLSRFFRSDDDLQCALYSTLYSGRFQRKFCESRWKVGTIPYHTARMISRAGAQPTGSWNCDWDRRAVWGYRELWLQEVSSFAFENNRAVQTGVTLFYMINPFGPSAGRLSR